MRNKTYQSESIRIRFSEKQKKRLLEEKNRTDRSVSDIVRQAVDEYFGRKRRKGADWGGSTNLKAAFKKVLDIAEKNNISQEEMPKAIVVISDMEIDYCGNRDWSFYDKMANKFHKSGYVIPNVIFWNVNSRHDVFHADSKRKGVQLASGQSVTVFKQILQNLGYNPIEAMENTINSERYACITVE